MDLNALLNSEKIETLFFAMTIRYNIIDFTCFINRSLRPSLEGPKSLPVTPKCSVEPNTPSPLVICSTSFDHHGGAKPKILPAAGASGTTKMVKSSSATGLSLMIPSEDSPICIQSPGGSSTASSRG